MDTITTKTSFIGTVIGAPPETSFADNYTKPGDRAVG